MMISGKKVFFLVGIATLLLAPCKCVETATLEPVAPQLKTGSAYLLFEHEYIDKPAWETKSRVMIPLKFVEDPDLPESYLIEGSIEGRLDAVAYGAGGPSGGCYLHCTIPGVFKAHGRHIAKMIENEFTCGIELVIEAEFDLSDITREGSCPDDPVQTWPCELLAAQVPTSETWVFTPGELELTKTSAGTVEKATLLEIKPPGDLLEPCDW
jgi:hypothetical protein